MVPEFGRAAEPPELDHRQREVEPERSAFCTISLLSSKLGLYCGEVSLMSQPLLPMGMKTPKSMPSAMQDARLRATRAGAYIVAGVGSLRATQE